MMSGARCLRTGRINMPKKKRYGGYDETVNDFGNSAYEILKARFVDVPSSVLSQLDEAVDYLQRIQDCKDQINKDGLMVSGMHGMVPHPLLKVQESATVQYYKLISGLMLTPNAMDKARKVDHTSDLAAIESLINP